MSILDALRSTRRTLDAWLDEARAGTPEERRLRQQVIDQQDEIDRLIDAIALVELQLAAADISARTAELATINAQIEATARSMATAQTILDVTAKVVAVAAAVIGAVG
jgi:DnaJ-domain-containing protein 1